MSLNSFKEKLDIFWDLIGKLALTVPEVEVICVEFGCEYLFLNACQEVSCAPFSTRIISTALNSVQSITICLFLA